MKIDFVRFEDININKWNGTVKYAQNSRIFGYYWYLKSIVREWDALVEGDYQSVMPIPRNVWSPFELRLLSECGPFSINNLSAPRAEAFFNVWKEITGGGPYNFIQSFSIPEGRIKELNLLKKQYAFLDIAHPYEVLFSAYDTALQNILQRPDMHGFEFETLNKPELILVDEKDLAHQKNILYRLFYNAIQRGIGWHAKVKNTSTGNSASVFFMKDELNIYPIYINSNPDEVALIILMDAMLKNYSGRPQRMYFPELHTEMLKGFKPTYYDILTSGRLHSPFYAKFFGQLKRFLGK